MSVLTWLGSHNVLCVVTQSIAECQGDSDGPRTVLCMDAGPHRVLQLWAGVYEGVHHLRLSTLRQPATQFTFIDSTVISMHQL